MQSDRQRIEAALEAIGDSGLDGLPDFLLDPVRYAIAGGGKRLRPLLTVLAYSAVGGPGDIAPLSISVELIHTYSLLHDDLPCMDDDDFRRGRPTVHRQFGVPRAIVAGAVLIPIAIRTVFRAGAAMGLDESRCAEIARVLLGAAGAGGMIGGQLLDLNAEGRELSLSELETIHRAKTGELILAAVRIGVIAAGAPEADRAPFDAYGRSLGLAFQIMDDVKDVTQTSESMGKATGRDAALRKSSYAALLGVEPARARAAALVAQATDALSARGLLTAKLSEVANFILARDA